MKWFCKSRERAIQERIDKLNNLFIDLYNAWRIEEDQESSSILAWHMKATDRAIRRMQVLKNKKHETES